MVKIRYSYRAIDGTEVRESRNYSGYTKEEAINKLLEGTSKSVTPIVSVEGKLLTEVQRLRTEMPDELDLLFPN